MTMNTHHMIPLIVFATLINLNLRIRVAPFCLDRRPAPDRPRPYNHNISTHNVLLIYKALLFNTVKSTLQVCIILMSSLLSRKIKKRDTTMNQNEDVRIVISLTAEFAVAVNQDGIEYAQDQDLAPLQEALKQTQATLVNVMRDFEYYVQSSEAHGAEDSPIIRWSRDATESERAKAYYGSKFVLSFAAGRKIVSRAFAESVVDGLKPLEGQGVVAQIRIDSMDPKSNPPIPERYFRA
jgi:hypothetical protein